MTGSGADIVANVLAATLSNALDPINYVSQIVQGADSRTVAWGDTALGWDVLRQVLDGSTDIFVWGNQIGTVPTNRQPVGTLTVDNFDDDFVTVDDGWQFATRAIGVSGSTVATAGGVDPWWGLVDRTLGGTAGGVTEQAQTVANDLLDESRASGMLLQPASNGKLLPGVELSFDDLRPGTLVNVDPGDRCIQTSAVFEVGGVSWSIGGGAGSSPRTASGQFATASASSVESVSLSLREVLS